MAERRAVRDLPNTEQTWPMILQWAQETGYRPIRQGDGGAHFQKGVGFWVAPQNLEVQVQGDSVHVEAWISANLFVRAMSLFILPSEITIASGGMKAALPRKMARGDVNKLMERLGQPPIE